MDCSSDGISRKANAGHFFIFLRGCAVLIAALLCVMPLAAQKKQKQKPVKDEALGALLRSVLPDADVLEGQITEMLAAWQIGDVELLHKHYADEVTVVSGLYEPPVQGWANYVQAYQRQRERMEQLRLDRFNTFIRVKGAIAWATYQWEFSAYVDKKPTGARGHTSLVFEKRADRWVILHNHTSVAEQMEVKQAAPPPAPAKPGT